MVMGAGLQCWDASGHLIVDTSDRMGRICGSVTTTTGGTGTQTFTIPAGCTGFWFASTVPDLAGSPNISLSGGTLTWTGGAKTTIFYGYF